MKPWNLWHEYHIMAETPKYKSNLNGDSFTISEMQSSQLYTIIYGKEINVSA